MNRIKKTDFIIIAVVLLLTAIVIASAVVGRERTGEGAGVSASDKNVTYQDYNGRKIGILTGTNMEAESFRYFPDSEYLYFDGYPNMNAALQTGKIDAYLGDEPALKSIHAEQPQIDYIKERLTNNQYSFAFRKNDKKEKKIRDQLNEFLARCRKDGTLAGIDSIWFGADDSKKVVDMTGLTGENGTLHVVTTSTDEPFSYIKDGKHVGYDIDVTVRFCRAYGYKLQIGDVDFAARIPALASGKYEFTTSMNVTPEREEAVLFSDPVSEGGIVVAVRTSDIAGDNSAAEVGFFEGVRQSFVKNFIREDRYQLILRGIGTTCLITLLSVLAGSVLAFLLCLFRRTDSVLAGKICVLFVRLLQGTPTVVLLMILYYVVFGKSGMGAVWVAIIGFSLNFAAYASEILRSGIDSVDGGQREAALALGFSENQAFFRFIFPQAVCRQLPVYRGEVISLLKSTSVVGYIAIQDLTKMSDIIRSRTYEAFFPLIATAIIYFLLAYIISVTLNAALKEIDPKLRRNRKKRGEAK